MTAHITLLWKGYANSVADYVRERKNENVREERDWESRGMDNDVTSCVWEHGRIKCNRWMGIDVGQKKKFFLKLIKLNLK